ncbi:hypothetical protein [Legionella steigerwaltii]|nr:hypothetical protein [Legionella steigerwaltii]
MFNKVESKSFTLTMLGTDTVYTPTLKAIKNKDKKPPLKIEDYPKGETLSLVSTLIKTENPVINHKQPVPYQSSDVAVVNGPKTDGTNVGDKIGIGLGIALNAIVRGQTELNDIAHSRGGVESILIAHELNAIKDSINSCENFEQLIQELTKQQTNRKNSKPFNNTPDIIKPLLTQLPQSTPEKQQWFGALKSNLAKASMNLFIIDPVPGDCWPVTWYDQRFFTLPPIVKYAEFTYYENERSDWGFTPIYVEASNPAEQRVVRNTLPGHHGTGSAGNNASQKSVVVSPEKTKATHVQKLMIFKLLKFLSSHGVAFKDAKEIFHEPTGLGGKYITFLEEMRGDGFDVEQFDFPAIFRKLYDKIYANRAAYEAFNATHYPLMGVAPQRKVLRTNHKYGFLTENFPKSTGYVNEEHSVLMKEYFFKILKVDSHKERTLVELIKSAQAVLSKNIKVITNLSSSVVEHPIAPAAILDSENARKDVLNSFGTLIQRVSQQYLMDDWSAEHKQKEKEELFAAIIGLFTEFEELKKIDNQTIKEFVASLIDMSLKGIIQTVDQQHANIEEEFNRLRTPTDTNLKVYFNSLLTQINKDESYSGLEINPEIVRIFESPAFAELANYPIRIKIEYICQQLQEKLPKSVTEKNLVDQLTERFEELYGSSFNEFEKLYHQIEVFINDTAALGRQFITEEAVFNKHELFLRKKAEALIDVAAQKFYRDRPNALPALAEKGTFKEAVERHAINKYGVIDRLKQEKEQLNALSRRMEEQLRTKDRQNEEVNASLEEEKAKKTEYHAAMNDDKEAEYLLLINKKLIPLTEEYLTSLRSQLSIKAKGLEQDEKTKQKDARIQSKIDKATELYNILRNSEQIPHPKMRLRTFYTQLDKYEENFIAHDDPDLVRYRRNAVIAAGILLSFIFPGLIVLAIYTNVGLSSVKSCYFWQSSGQNAVSSLNRHRAAAGVPFADAVKDEVVNEDEEANIKSPSPEVM